LNIWINKNYRKIYQRDFDAPTILESIPTTKITHEASASPKTLIELLEILYEVTSVYIISYRLTPIRKRDYIALVSNAKWKQYSSGQLRRNEFSAFSNISRF
jgi:hypothetical protein